MSLRKRLRVGLVAATVFAIVASVFVAVPQTAQALTGSQFDPGYIVSDAVFFNKNAMTETQIQAFLEARLPSCAEAKGVKCLKNYTETTVDRAASPAGNCAFYQGAAAERASRIIFKVAQACGINPQVILVTLQKEQGLITEGSPSALAIRSSMGYGCPDTAACDARYYGFYNQIYSAAWQFKQYGINAQNWRYHIGAVTVSYAPVASCGGTVVNIRNQATANLYNYTPYQPDAAALNNLGGLGVKPCSSYGNRNFWVYFNNWFGSPVGAVSPYGTLDLVALKPGAVQLGGWAFDPDTKEPIDVHVYVNGVGTAFTANLPRPDVDAAYGGVGANHGYNVTVPVVTGGAQQVCVYAINVGPGANSLLNCTTITPRSGSPFGSLDSVVGAAGMITTSGWTIDPDTSDPIPVHIYVDNSGVAYTADQPRDDIAAAYTGYGSPHGFSFSVPVAGGKHTVCAYGINVSGGANTLLGCRVVTVAGGSPAGAVDSVVVAPGTITVSGWTLDPDSTASNPVHVYLGASGNAFAANKSRSDIASIYSGYGDLHGFTETIAAIPGTYSVCSYGIDIAGGNGNSSLGCRLVKAMSGPPVGVVDSITASAGLVTASGWVFDPDTAASASIRIEVDSVPMTAVAGLPRLDVGAAYPAYGVNHGYTQAVAATPGSHTVCVYGVNTGAGSDSLLGCRTVTT